MSKLVAAACVCAAAALLAAAAPARAGTMCALGGCACPAGEHLSATGDCARTLELLACSVGRFPTSTPCVCPAGDASACLAPVTTGGVLGAHVTIRHKHSVKPPGRTRRRLGL